jgi:hypothetical protein
MDITQDRAHRSWRIAERVKRLSDKLIGVGPVGVGLDAVLDWVPGAGPVYSAGAGAVLIYEAVAAGASKATIARMAVYLVVDTGTSSVPIVGWAVDALFPGHLLAAKALQKDIERRFGKPATGMGGFSFRRRPRDEAEIDLPREGWKVREG